MWHDLKVDVSSSDVATISLAVLCRGSLVGEYFLSSPPSFISLRSYTLSVNGRGIDVFTWVPVSSIPLHPDRVDPPKAN